MSDRPTNTRDVFIQGVADALAGTPNANHPVQYEMIGFANLSSCTLCHAVVTESAQDDHRKWHTKHNLIHDEILAEAMKHRPEPRYG